MLVEHLLNLPRVDVVAPADDQLLLAVHDEVAPVLVHPREVARVEPALGIERLGGCVRAPPVPLHEVMAANHDLADLALGHRLAIGVDEPHLHSLHRGPNRAGLADPVGVVEARHGRGLREPVALQDHTPEGLLESVQGLDRDRRPARDADPQRAGVKALTLGLVQERRVHRRHALEHGHALGLDRRKHLGGVEPGHKRQRGPQADGHVESARLSEGVEQGQRAEDHILGSRAEQFRGDLGVASQVRVGELGPLGLAGRARGVEDHRGVIAVALGDLVDRIGGEQLLRRGHDHALGARGRRAGLGLAREAVPGEHQARPRVAQVERHLALLQKHVHRDHGGAGPQRAVVDDRELGDVGEHHTDRVAGADPLLEKQAGDPGRRGVELCVGEYLLPEQQCRMVGCAPRGLGQLPGQIAHLISLDRFEG